MKSKSTSPKTFAAEESEIIVIDDETEVLKPAPRRLERLGSEETSIRSAPQTPPLAQYPNSDSTRYSERELNTLFGQSISQFVLMALLYTQNSQLYRYLLVEMVAPLMFLTASPEISLLNLMAQSKAKVQGNVDKLSVADLEIHQSFPMEEETIGYLLKVFMKQHAPKRGFQQMFAAANADDMFEHLDANDRLNLLLFVMNKWMDLPQFGEYIDKVFVDMHDADLEYAVAENSRKARTASLGDLESKKQSVNTKQVISGLLQDLKTISMEVGHYKVHTDKLKSYLEHLQAGSEAYGEPDRSRSGKIAMARNEMEIVRKTMAAKVAQHRLKKDELSYMQQLLKTHVAEEAKVGRAMASPPVNDAIINEKHKRFEQYRLRTFFLQNQAIGYDANNMAYWMLQTVNGVVVTVDGLWCRHVDEGIQALMETLTHSKEQHIKGTLSYWSASKERFQSKLSKEPVLRVRLIDTQYREALAANTCNMFNYIVRVSLNPAIKDPDNVTYRHFIDYAFDFEYHQSVPPLIFDDSPSYFGPLYSYITSVFRILITPKKVSNRKKASNYAPLLFCFTDHEIEQVRVADLKQTEQTLNTYRRLLGSCTSLDELSFLIMLLHETIQTNVEDEPAYQDTVDDQAFEQWIAVQRLTARSNNTSTQSMAPSNTSSNNNENESGNSEASSSNDSAEFIVKVVESDNEQLQTFVDVSPKLKMLGIARTDSDDNDDNGNDFQSASKRPRRTRDDQDLPKIKFKLRAKPTRVDDDRQSADISGKTRTAPAPATLVNRRSMLPPQITSPTSKLTPAYTVSTASLSKANNDDDDVDFTTTSSDDQDGMSSGSDSELQLKRPQRTLKQRQMKNTKKSTNEVMND